MGWCWAEQHWELVLGALGCSRVGLKHLSAVLFPMGRQWGEHGNGNPACCSQSQKEKADLSPEENEKWVGMMASINHSTVLLVRLQVGKTELISTKLRKSAEMLLLAQITVSAVFQ